MTTRSPDISRKLSHRSKNWSNLKKEWWRWRRQWNQDRFRFTESRIRDLNWLWRATPLPGRYKIWNKSKTKRLTSSLPFKTSKRLPRATYLTQKGLGSWRVRCWTVSVSSSSSVTSSPSQCASNCFQKSSMPISPGGSKAFQFPQGVN